MLATNPTVYTWIKYLGPDNMTWTANVYARPKAQVERYVDITEMVCEALAVRPTRGGRFGGHDIGINRYVEVGCRLSEALYEDPYKIKGERHPQDVGQAERERKLATERAS